MSHRISKTSYNVRGIGTLIFSEDLESERGFYKSDFENFG
jgi:hypothetical protein